ncbi:tRNA (N6-threonylcarbamoyladenosine(37)-N6)-methyltransferase TrmO [Methanofollis formosanus]|uniref:tRNA (N6-threonylcarbamoyladenosine(37)-N6)-methyltransferase TrmO n=2 Tax=Methanofollis formosanus TaxID=299308 RepID=A0A8G1A4V1_9EURY|nr:tRNA (N6-threonylcarbamoyladenosine(37)-N6)-methyltransferase TrmO [Methanofollis formosanus]
MILRPVGVVRNTIKEPFLIAGDDGIAMRGDLDDTMRRVRETEEETSEIIINMDLIETLDGIEDYSHLTVLYWAHGVPEKSRILTRVHPMGRKDIPATGVFGTCSPARPNPVLMTVVRLCGRNGNVLEVADLDAIDGSPVIDIKPYVRDFFPQHDVKIPEWMQQIQREVNRSDR